MPTTEAALSRFLHTYKSFLCISDTMHCSSPILPTLLLDSRTVIQLQEMQTDMACFKKINLQYTFSF